MVSEFINFYGKNISNLSKPMEGIKDFLNWAKQKKYFNGSLHE